MPIEQRDARTSKILLVLESTGAGVGRHILDLAGELDRLGHFVHLAYSGRRMEAAFRRELEQLERIKTVQVDMRRAPHPSDVKAVLKIRRYLKHAGPFDVIHGHSSKGGAIARLAATGLPGIRVYTPHALRTLDPLLPTASRWLYRTIENALCRVTDAIVLVSEEESEHARLLGLAAEKLFVVPNGIAPHTVESRDQARRRLKFSDGKLYIGFVGRLVAQKDPICLVSAFARLAPRYDNAHLVMLGDGPLSSEARALAAQLKVNDRISWLQDLKGPELMPALDIFVMPSRYEAFPYVLLEAAAASLPIVATPVGGTSAVIADGVNGLLTDVEHLTDALAKLLDDPLLRTEMGRASGEKSKSFTIESMARGTLEVYQAAACRDLQPA